MHPSGSPFWHQAAPKIHQNTEWDLDFMPIQSCQRVLIGDPELEKYRKAVLCTGNCLYIMSFYSNLNQHLPAVNAFGLLSCNKTHWHTSRVQYVLWHFFSAHQGLTKRLFSVSSSIICFDPTQSLSHKNQNLQWTLINTPIPSAAAIHLFVCQAAKSSVDCFSLCLHPRNGLQTCLFEGLPHLLLRLSHTQR